MFSMDRYGPARARQRLTDGALTALLHGPLGNSCACITRARARKADQMGEKECTTCLTAAYGDEILVSCRPLRPAQAWPHLCPIAGFRPSLDSQPRSAAVEPATRPEVLAGRSQGQPGHAAGAPVGAA
jgi:hypothetical protein